MPQSVTHQARKLNFAIDRLKLGVRRQCLEAETSLSSARLVKFDKSIQGVRSPDGLDQFIAHAMVGTFVGMLLMCGF